MEDGKVVAHPPEQKRMDSDRIAEQLRNVGGEVEEEGRR